MITAGIPELSLSRGTNAVDACVRFDLYVQLTTVKFLRGLCWYLEKPHSGIVPLNVTYSIKATHFPANSTPPAPHAAA